MKSLIHTNPTTNETRWCVANVVADLTVDVYIQAVDLGFRDDDSHKPENFHWVEELEGVSMSTHRYTDEGFVELSPLPVSEVIPLEPSPTETNS